MDLAPVPQPPEDHQVYVWFMRFNALLDTLITSLIIYLVIKRTPKEMKVYKWFLLNLSLCCYVLDAHLTLIFLPIPLYPAFAGCALGIMSPLGYAAPVVSWLIFLQLLCSTGIAIFLALLFRLAAVYQQSEMFQRKSVVSLCIVLQCCCGMPSFIVGLCIFPREEQSLTYIQMNYPTLLPFYQTHPCAVMLTDSDMLMHYLYAIVPTSTVIYTLIMSCLVLLGWRLRSMKHNMSAKTYKMHKSLTISLCFQFALPACMLACSEICFCMSAILQVDSARTIFYVSYIFSTLHTFANGIIMIAFVKPYRDACFSILSPLHDPIRRRFFPAKRKTTLVISQELTTGPTFTQPFVSNMTKRITPIRGRSSCPQ